ncbi:hypothetical protein AMS68_006687 [Peltaster fructicola]|uniref:beta-glucosidase n=1 Tax=Peltaster fructicola TaxID=286661 RepID=A0A6H0Y3F6_9PEZI|nr:hypothetical protein AMS68_006687 [Peltaster fructicola]
MLNILSSILLPALLTRPILAETADTPAVTQWPVSFTGSCSDWSDDSKDERLTSWDEALSRAGALVDQMNNTEKALLTLGSGNTEGCSGFVGPLSRLNFSGICLNDGPAGVKGKTFLNAFPAQLSIGASWNRTLAGERGRYMGRGFKAKGVNIALGPVVGPLGRVATGGRNWEGFSNDPYLAGALVGPTIDGIQESVVACVKHYIGNEQETNRNPYYLGLTKANLNQSVSSNIDDRTMHELYLWPFYDAVRAQVGAVMCSYNKINNTYACQDDASLNGLLKKELGFRGLVVTDWTGDQAGLPSNKGGTDMVMPVSIYETPDSINAAIVNGTFEQARLDDQVTRILAAYYKFADFYKGGVNGTANIDARESAAESNLLQGAIEGHVLVKNTESFLPLSKPAVINLFGYDAVGGLNSSGAGDPSFLATVAQKYTNGLEFTSAIANSFLYSTDASKHAGPEVALNGTLLMGGGSGFTDPTSSISPFDSFVKQAAIDGTTLHYDFNATSPKVLSPEAPCIVFINAFASETWDRSGLYDEYSDDLIQSVAEQCANTLVVIHNAGVRVVDAWIENPNIKAVLYAHTPGQYSGSALVELIYGRQSPSGRLPYTVTKNESDYGSLLYPTLPEASNPYNSQSNFTEGLNIDYKHFIANAIEPRFAFGFGLTYSTFEYSSLDIDQCSCAYEWAPDAGVVGDQAPEGSWESLYDVLANVEVTVQNTGKVAAAEVAQLYLSIPGSGQKMVLRGFDKKLLQPGQDAVFSFSLRRRDLSIWNVVRQTWILPEGDFDIMVGKSVEDVQLTGVLHIEHA